MSADLIKRAKEDFDKVITALKTGLATVRTGRATPQILNGVQVHVSAYGATMPLSQLAGVAAPDARLLVVNPHDKSTMADIEKAIKAANLGLNPSNDGKVINVPIPPLTTQRRDELAKQVKKLAEEAKVRARQVRKDQNDLAKKKKDGGEFTEDQQKKFLDQIQKTTDACVADIDKLAAAKEKEVKDS
jgi:ribosome recycling factor